MKTATGISFLDFKKASTTADFPDQFSHYLKSLGDIYFWEKGNFHVVTKAEDARNVLTNPIFSADRGGFFISRMPDMDLSLIQDFFGVVKKMMVMSDDEEHSKRRKIASSGFEDHIIDRFAKTVQQTVKKLVDEVKDKNQFDFVDISKRLPSTILADLFSIPESDRENFFTLANTMTGFFGGASNYQNADGIEVNNAAKALKSYFENLIVSRRNSNGEDYVSILVRAQKMTQLTDEELVSQMIMMLVAGQVTTTDQINNIMYLFAKHTDIQLEVKKNPLLIANAIEELKRIDPAVTFIFRVARADGMLNSQPIKTGDVIFISTHCVNRDLPLEEKPDEIRIERKAAHFAYGHGPHYCLGAKLGRLQIRLLFEELFKELPLLTLNETLESKRDHYSLSFSGFTNLELAQR
ncbi:cytochrome P450 [Bacteriovorax sp. PP10]|uniref:Cytochrome P450 n=1 Tax=Bacteriovorax antarcticus TaxID=3088717 RepID=A0ABU5VSL5_9BACT|nr:cytochrome P450 [Bacteriovorax sp. PP10]MEA9356047.1 cytochrome P450 [Bacteriovorax sp. PP10]